jgi:hypothetical protein
MFAAGRTSSSTFLGGRRRRVAAAAAVARSPLRRSQPLSFSTAAAPWDYTAFAGAPKLRIMTVEQKNFYDANGYVKVPGVFSATHMADIRKWVEEIGSWGEYDSKWMHSLEDTPDGPRLSRTEFFVAYHQQLSRLLMTGTLPALVGDALGEPAFLYKEKLNWKHPGGAGYHAHQDAPAYNQIKHHSTCLLSVDASTHHNGCLEFAAARHLEGLIGLTADGIVSQEEEAKMDFTACETEPGDVVIFSSYVPHRSRPNHSENSRNLLYLTYNAQSEGYQRDEYCASHWVHPHRPHPTLALALVLSCLVLSHLPCIRV